LKSAALLNNQTAGVGWTEFFFNLRQANPSDIAGAGQSVGPDGERTADDIINFLNGYFANDCRSDIAGPGQGTAPDGQFTADDIINFNNMFLSQEVLCGPLPLQPPVNPPVGLRVGGGSTAAASLVAVEGQSSANLGLLANQIAARLAVETDPVARAAWMTSLGYVLEAQGAAGASNR
jgi:hypothetical protein